MSKGGYIHSNRRRLSRHVIVVSLLIIGIIMILADRQQKSMLVSGRLAADDINSKVLTVMSAPIRGVESLFSNIEARQNALKENKYLRAELARLQNVENRLRHAEMRLKTFETLHNIDDISELPKTKVLVRVISETNGPFTRSALINAGRNKNIERGNAAMSTDGLYGHVVRVGNVSSRILLLGDLNSRISVMSQRSNARAIMVGNNTTRPSLEYIAKNADWQVSDRVVTSGDGGVLPQGLIIGEVVLAKDGNFYVEPFSAKKPVDWVFVYKFKPINPPAETKQKNTDEKIMQMGDTDE